MTDYYRIRGHPMAWCGVAFCLGAILGLLLGISLANAAEEVSGTVTVVDADTIDVGETRVRLWGVNSPETTVIKDGHRVPNPPGVEAQTWARAEWTGITVTCRVRGPKSYGRTVAQCFRAIRGGGLSDLGFEVVRAGHAVDVPRFSGGYYK